MARTDERGPWLIRLEERRAVQRDCTGGVRADLRVRDDAVRVVADKVLRQPERLHGEPHEDDRRGEELLVGSLREGGVERLLLDVGCLERAVVLVDEPRAPSPRRCNEVLGSQRPERKRRGERRQPERTAGRAEAELEEAAA